MKAIWFEMSNTTPQLANDIKKGFAITREAVQAPGEPRVQASDAFQGDTQLINHALKRTLLWADDQRFKAIATKLGRRRRCTG